MLCYVQAVWPSASLLTSLSLQLLSYENIIIKYIPPWVKNHMKYYVAEPRVWKVSAHEPVIVFKIGDY